MQTLDYCEKVYVNLIKNYTLDKPNKENTKVINRQIATLHWLLSHSMPYMRGSDVISNTFIKALYSALGFQTAVPKDGISFHPEAFCTELDEYVEKYPSLYENPPKYVL